MRLAPTPALVLALASPALADVRLPSLFADHMVLQREMDAPVWGWADPDETVTVRASWLEAEVTTQAGEDGTFRVTVRTPEAGGPHTLSVNGIELEDVLVGEVWIASGQSNMEMPLANIGGSYSGVLDGEAEIAAADFPHIRLFDVPHEYALEPHETCGGAWLVCSPETVGRFSATAYFFGRELHERLGVPIGLIGSNWGGTLCEAWTSREALERHRGFEEGLTLVHDAVENPERLEAMQSFAERLWWNEVTVHDAGALASPPWSEPSAEDGSWKTAALPGIWETNGLAGFDGLVWYRRAIEVPESWAGRELVVELGPVDDMDDTWFDGERIGGSHRADGWTEPRRYAVPAELATPGEHVIAVRVVDTGGWGGLHGPPEAMRLAPKDASQEAISLAGEWRYHASTERRALPEWPNTLPHHNSPSVLYNGMIAPLVPYGIRGAIWYQGESNRMRARQYRTLFPNMIRDWREQWGEGDFPFYYVQIAPFGYGGDRGEAAELREAQRLALSAPNTGMVVTMDIGNARDIHPKNKQEVGRRLALLALAGTYGKDVVCSGPMFRSMDVDGSVARLHFDHAEGLQTRDGKPELFEIAGADGPFVHAQAAVEGDVVVVWSLEVATPVAVRYAWGAADEAELFNGAGLPASSFRTDSD